MMNFVQGKVKNLKIKHILLCVFAFFMISSLAFLVTKNLKQIHAYDFSSFNPGNIISDGVMANYNAMSVEEIQRFLTSKNACRDTNIAKARSYPNLRYHVENGRFICLSEETFEYNGQKQTAAQIIFEAARDFQINSQVLIVLLEKEQGLITDTWPNHIQYRSATGFGCPDTAECDSKYYGFRNQVRNAASLFRSVLNGGWTNYPVGRNYVQYNPDPNCGGSVVNIENRATSALYRYTPYQPNVGSLANYPGTAYCGAYGNRNFYVTFNQWFGNSTQIKKEELKPLNKPDQNSSQDGSIDNGEYTIKTLLDKTKYLDVREGNKDSGALVQLYSKWSNNNIAQKWNIESIGDEIYKIKSKLSGKNLSFDVNSIETNPQIKLENENLDDCSQRWNIQKKETGEFRFISSCDVNHSINVKDENPVDESPVQINKKNNNKAQAWVIEKVNPNKETQLIQDGIYNITTALNNNQFLDVAKGNTEDYAKVQLFHKWRENNAAQQWQFKHLGNNEYQIISKLSNKAISVNLNKVQNGEQLFLLPADSNSCSQKWKAIQNGTGFVFKNSCNPIYVMDVNASLAIDENRVQLWGRWGNNNKAQAWVIEKVNPNKETQLIQDGIYNITTALNNNQFLDVAKGNTEDYAKVQLFHKWRENNAAQQWQFKHLGNNEYQIISKLSNKAISVNLNKVQNGEQLFLLPADSNSCSQKWKAIQNGTGFVFKNSCNPIYVMDVNASLAIDENRIQLWGRWGEDNRAQFWILQRIL